jgi:hypothetical protein
MKQTVEVTVVGYFITFAESTCRLDFLVVVTKLSVLGSIS